LIRFLSLYVIITQRGRNALALARQFGHNDVVDLFEHMEALEQLKVSKWWMHLVVVDVVDDVLWL
jgi:S-adenosylmethionine:diacylglycerol 3-amino-3-carboxypropyl transferase